jgi:hypothetical protein
MDHATGIVQSQPRDEEWTWGHVTASGNEKGMLGQERTRKSTLSMDQKGK